MFEAILSDAALNPVQRALEQLDSKYSARQLFDTAFIATLLCAIFGVLLVNAGLRDLGLFFFFVAALPLVFAYYLPIYLAHRRTLKLEENIATFLLQAASFPSNYPLTEILRRVAKDGDFGPLSREFAIAYSQIKAGLPFKDALLKIAERNDSELLNRVVHLLVHAYISGADMSLAFKETAEDVFELQDIFRLRAAGLVIQKYTILLAAAIIVPALLAVIGGIVKNLGFSGLSNLGFSAANKAVFNMSSMGNIVYIALYSIIAGLFVAYLDGNIKKAIVYCSILLPFAFLVFFVFSNINVFALFS